MGDVVAIEAYLPHFCIPAHDGSVHVVPVSLVRDWAEGRRNLPRDKEGVLVIQSILQEWLSGVEYD